MHFCPTYARKKVTVWYQPVLQRYISSDNKGRLTPYHLCLSSLLGFLPSFIAHILLSCIICSIGFTLFLLNLYYLLKRRVIMYCICSVMSFVVELIHRTKFRSMSHWIFAKVLHLSEFLLVFFPVVSLTSYFDPFEWTSSQNSLSRNSLDLLKQ